MIIISFFQKIPIIKIINWIIVIICIILIIGGIVRWKNKKIQKRAIKQGFLFCPIRGLLRVKKYDSGGNYSEEYQRIWLIRHFLNKGYSKSQFILEYPIRIGHKGHNILRVDLVIKKENKVLIVAEVKKAYKKNYKYSAIYHQLIPAMQILRSPYAIYFDGSSESCCLIRQSNGNIVVKKFVLV